MSDTETYRCDACDSVVAPDDEKAVIQRDPRHGDLTGVTCGDCMRKANQIADAYADPR